MKSPGFLIALGLIGYGIYKFTQSGKSSGLGSPFKSSGTAKIPSVFGAAKPTTAPVFGGYSKAPVGRGATGGASQFDLAAAADAAKGAYRFVSGLFRRSPDGTIDFNEDLDYSDEPLIDFTDDLDFESPLTTGFDDVDTGIYEGQV